MGVKGIVRVADGLAVPVHAGMAEDVAPGVGVAVLVGRDGVSVTGCVAGGTIRVGDDVRMVNTSVRVQVGEEVCVTISGVGVRAEPDRNLVGVGVSRKTPGTTSSLPSTCPSSRRIASNTAGFIGATSS